MRSEKATFTNMCMVYDGNRVLVQEPSNQSFPGIRFPGGHINLEESFVESTIREVFEETGLTISHLELCGVKQFQTQEDGRYVVFLYKTDSFTGELKQSKEGRVFWVDYNEIENLKCCAHFHEMLQVFQGEYTEFQYVASDDEWKVSLK